MGNNSLYGTNSKFYSTNLNDQLIILLNLTTLVGLESATNDWDDCDQ